MGQGRAESDAGHVPPARRWRQAGRARPVSQKILFRVPQCAFEGTFNDNAIANAITQQLPMSSEVSRWGDEIYFDVPVTIPNTQPTLDVTVGDIAYWPDGPCLCTFFGQTPASKADEPRPASNVTIVGHTEASVDLLRSIKAGTRIVIDHASQHQDQTV